MAEKRTLVIGDVHGHVDRLQALLEQEGVVENGQRVNDDVRVVQLGDLGHFGCDYTADEDCYRHALRDHWIDTVLWGNHDRAVVDPHHSFTGYSAPIGPVREYMNELQRQGRYVLAAHAHGHFLTHAGLAQRFDPFLPASLEDAVEILNSPPSDPGVEFRISGAPVGNPDPLWDAVNGVGRSRGGFSLVGGILWRDISESLSDKFDQVFGHSAQCDGQPKRLESKLGKVSHCVDIGGKYEARLGGIWLPEMEYVRVDLGTTEYA